VFSIIVGTRQRDGPHLRSSITPRLRSQSESPSAPVSLPLSRSAFSTCPLAQAGEAPVLDSARRASFASLLSLSLCPPPLLPPSGYGPPITPPPLSPSSEGVSSFAETPPAAHSHSLRSRRERGTERLTTAVKRGRGREGSVVRSCAWSAKERSPPLSLHRSPVRVILIEKVLCSAEP
jgi:hypothetical protein